MSDNELELVEVQLENKQEEIDRKIAAFTLLQLSPEKVESWQELSKKMDLILAKIRQRKASK